MTALAISAGVIVGVLSFALAIRAAYLKGRRDASDIAIDFMRHTHLLAVEAREDAAYLHDELHEAHRRLSDCTCIRPMNAVETARLLAMDITEWPEEDE